MTDLVINIASGATVAQVADQVETLLGAGGDSASITAEGFLGLVNTPPVTDSQGNQWMRVRIPDEYLQPLQMVSDQSNIATVVAITSGPYEVEPGVSVGMFA